MTDALTSTGAKDSRSGNVTRRRSGSTPLRTAASCAAAAARRRYSSLSRCRGFGAPLGSRAGVNSRSKPSRSDRAPDSAARSAARCVREVPVTAPPIAASTAAQKRITNAAATTIMSACPPSAASAGIRSRLWAGGRRLLARGPRPAARRTTRLDAAPPDSSPASARRVATRPSGRVATRTGMRRARSSITVSAASERSRGRSARSRAPAGVESSPSTAARHSSGGR